MCEPIYLDNLATTRLAPEALEAMLPWLRDHYGNASSSTHRFGWEAADAVERARAELSGLIGARRGSEIIFTSGATESNNTVIQGVANRSQGSPIHMIVSAIEHPSILSTCRELDPRIATVTIVPPDATGAIDPQAVAGALRPETALVSIMAANNEIGTVQPIAEIAAIAHAHGALFHADGAQALGKIEIDVERQGIDLLSVSAHKFNGPQGVGALYVRSGAVAGGLPALLHGGGQQHGRRSGTLPVPLIVGMGAASRLARASWRGEAIRIGGLAAHLLAHLRSEIPGLSINGAGATRLPGCLNFSIPGVLADALIATTPGVAFSSASACASHHGGSSHVLAALGLDRSGLQGSVRIGIGRYNSREDVRIAGELIVQGVRRLRSPAGRGPR
jgi:cysteine desulfurase